MSYYYSIGQMSEFQNVASNIHSDYLKKDIDKTNIKYSEMSLMEKVRLDYLTENEILLAKDDVKNIHQKMIYDLMVEEDRYYYHLAATIGSFVIAESLILGLYFLVK